MKHVSAASEIPRKTSAERVRRHRAMMRARGFRMVQLWVSGSETAAEVAEAVRRQRSPAARSPESDLADEIIAAFEAR